MKTTSLQKWRGPHSKDEDDLNPLNHLGKHLTSKKFVHSCVSWGKLRKVKESWGKLRRDEKSWGKLGKVEESWGKLTKVGES